MKMKFTLTEIIRNYTSIENKYGYVDIKKVYECSNYDDLQNLFLTLVDFSTEPLRFEIKKEVIEEEDA